MQSSISRLLFVLLLSFFAPIVRAQVAGAYSSFGSANYHNKMAVLNWLKYQKAKENGENLKSWWHGESSGGIAFAPPIKYTLRSKYDSLQSWNQASYDTAKTGTGKPLMGYFANGVSDHLLFRVGESSMVSFSWGVQIYILRYKMPYIYPNESINGEAPSVLMIGGGIPATIDFKWGCDVDWNADKRFCAAVGAGIYPHVRMGGFSIFSENMVGQISPYFYASMGVYAGGCWKVRASYMPANMKVFSDRADNSGGVTRTLNMQTNGGVFMLGIAHCGYSGDWRRGRAWRVPLRGSGNGRRGGSLNSMRLF